MFIEGSFSQSKLLLLLLLIFLVLEVEYPRILMDKKRNKVLWFSTKRSVIFMTFFLVVTDSNKNHAYGTENLLYHFNGIPMKKTVYLLSPWGAKDYTIKNP